MIRQLETIFKKHYYIQYGLFHSITTIILLYLLLIQFIKIIHLNKVMFCISIHFHHFKVGINSVINIIKRISNCIVCRVATSPYNHGDPTDDDILLLNYCLQNLIDCLSRDIIISYFKYLLFKKDKNCCNIFKMINKYKFT